MADGFEIMNIALDSEMMAPPPIILPLTADWQKNGTCLYGYVYMKQDTLCKGINILMFDK